MEMNHFTDEYRKELNQLANEMQEVGYTNQDIQLTKDAYSYELMMKELGVRIL
jgi:hypothetical protein